MKYKIRWTRNYAGKIIDNIGAACGCCGMGALKLNEIYKYLQESIENEPKREGQVVEV